MYCKSRENIAVNVKFMKIWFQIDTMDQYLGYRRHLMVACCVVVSLTELKSIYTLFVLLFHRNCSMKYIAVMKHIAAFQIDFILVLQYIMCHNFRFLQGNTELCKKKQRIWQHIIHAFFCAFKCLCILVVCILSLNGGQHLLHGWVKYEVFWWW